ncbi:TetR family transcriptional regulator OS=Cellulomonas persica OX=76861 GN=CPE01_04630 PE=4 SV=1 [Cellulomonas persica]|uniref:TetR family transcriptional regulator n=1 Tax=Cellulomonas persica TaxID=76861 RepID=A0A510UU66_9CELL|nr:TetR family transcriptional regulator [Cellulomonas persica]
MVVKRDEAGGHEVGDDEARGAESTARRGRRPGASTTRDEILAAARRQFAELGFRRTSVRAIAREAGVDPKLVGHWFGGKAELFVASVQLPFSPRELADRIAQGDPDRVGERLVTALVHGVLEDPAARGRGIALLRAVATEPQLAPLLRRLVVAEVLTPVARAIGADHAEVRASLVASQMVGLLMMRHVVELGPLVERGPDELVALVAPTVQRYLTGELPLA